MTWLKDRPNPADMELRLVRSGLLRAHYLDPNLDVFPALNASRSLMRATGYTDEEINSFDESERRLIAEIPPRTAQQIREAVRATYPSLDGEKEAA